jgi:MinD superfamily P-loop ATPase
MGDNLLKFGSRSATTPSGKGGDVYEIDQERCRKVGDCVEACPIAVIEMKEDGSFNVGEDCTDCGGCEPVCDNKAIRHVQ